MSKKFGLKEGIMRTIYNLKKKVSSIIFMFMFNLISSCILLVNFGFAHDYWIEPNKFILSKSETLILHLYVGDKLNKEIEREFQKHMTPKFELFTDSVSLNLIDEVKDKQLPILTKKIEFEGLALISMERDWSYIELKPHEFSEYLKHEELQDIEKLWKKLPARNVERERYKRPSIKALIRVGDKMAGEVYKKILGQQLEIILLNNPYKIKTGDELKAQVLFEGKPFANKVVMAFHRDKSSGKVSEYKVKTNKNGIARFKIENPGMWLIRLVHLRECRECKDLDWESFWASYSFEVTSK